MLARPNLHIEQDFARRWYDCIRWYYDGRTMVTRRVTTIVDIQHDNRRHPTRLFKNVLRTVKTPLRLHYDSSKTCHNVSRQWNYVTRIATSTTLQDYNKTAVKTYHNVTTTTSRCSCGKCWFQLSHVDTSHVINPEVIFRSWRCLAGFVGDCGTFLSLLDTVVALS